MSRPLASAVLLLAAAWSLPPSLASAAPLERLTVERINDPGLSGPVPTRLAWTRDGERLTYLRPSGEGGTAHFEFKVAHGVNKTCGRCGGPIQRIVVRQRGTYLCPKCQKNHDGRQP